MKKILVLLFLAMASGGCYYPRYYGLPAPSGNYVYDGAYWREQVRLYRDARRQAEAAERERARKDAQQGVYRPW